MPALHQINLTVNESIADNSLPQFWQLFESAFANFSARNDLLEDLYAQDKTTSTSWLQSYDPDTRQVTFQREFTDLESAELVKNWVDANEPDDWTQFQIDAYSHFVVADSQLSQTGYSDPRTPE